MGSGRKSMNKVSLDLSKAFKLTLLSMNYLLRASSRNHLSDGERLVLLSRLIQNISPSVSCMSCKMIFCSCEESLLVHETMLYRS